MMDSPDRSIENPLRYKYVRILRLFLYPIGAWPGEVFGEKIPFIVKFIRNYFPVQTAFILVGQIMYLYKYIMDLKFLTLGHCIVTVSLAIMTFSRNVIPLCKSYSEIVKTFLMTMHLAHIKHKAKYNKKMCNFIDELSFSFVSFLMAVSVISCALYNVSPMYHNYANGAFTRHRSENVTLEYSVYYAYPGFNPAEHFTFTTILNIILSCNCSASICTTDLLLILTAFQIIGHVQILQNSFKTFPKPKPKTELQKSKSEIYKGTARALPRAAVIPITNIYDDEENKIIHVKLVESINHHKLIVSFAKELSTFFGPVLGINYLFHLSTLCLLLIVCSPGDPDALLTFGPLTIAAFGQLIQMSVTFEIVGALSEKLKDSVYSIPWECMDSRNRRTVCILLNRIQTPIQVTALGMTPVGVTTMARILKTTFSYFAFLRSMNT